MAETFDRPEIRTPENLVYSKTKVLTDNIMHYCPGCGHGTTHRLLAEVIDRWGFKAKPSALHL